MSTARQDLHRKTKANEISDAVRSVIEGLESRTLLSAAYIHPRSHMVMDAPLPGTETITQSPTPGKVLFTTPPKTSTIPGAEYPAGTIRIGTGTTTPAQVRHLYGLDKLDAYNSLYPLYLNKGDGETIVIVGAAAREINTAKVNPQRTGNLDLFDTANNVVKGPNDVAIDPFNPGPTDNLGEVETMMQIEWAHAMAPYAQIILVEVPSTLGVIAPSDMIAGIQEGINDLQFSQVQQLNQFSPGGVITMSLASVGEDPTAVAQLDAVLANAPANVSFIAPTGDFGSELSSPADSPYVTGVGGTLYKIDATGNRIYETASLASGGGQSTVEPLPGFQAGVRVGRTPLTSRGTPDMALISQQQGNGVKVYYDPTPKGTDPSPNYTEEGTSVAAPILAGMIADANELRANVGLGTIGNQLNNTIYQGYRQVPKLLYTDITQGNNGLHKAVKGYDLATGVGAPKADSFIPYLAGIVNVTSNVRMTANYVTSLATSPVTTANFRAVGTAAVGSQYVSFSNLALNSSNPKVSATFTPTGVITRAPDNTITGTGTITVTRTVTTGTKTTTTTTPFTVQIDGRVTGKSVSPRVSATFYAVDASGRRISPGSADSIQGQFTT